MAATLSQSTSATEQSAAPFGASLLQAWQAEYQRATLQSLKTFEVLTGREPEPVGQTPKDVVWSRGTTRLYRYRATTPTRHPVPLLMVHSLVSKPYILDLIPGNSFVEYLVGQGFDTYLIDWGTPRPEDHVLRLEDYVLEQLPAAIEVVLERSGATEFSLFGYCMGGLLALLYAATHPNAPLRNLVTLATPVDFSNMGLQSFWSQEPYMNVDRLVDTYGNIPAAMIKESFRLLRPASEYSPVRFISLWQNVLDDRFVQQYRAFDRWTNEHIPFPGECFRQTTKALARENRLAKGTMELGGREATLSNITCSFLAVAAESDHIVPLAATNVQPDLVSSADKELVVMPGGHVGLAAGRKAVRTLWPKVAGWLAERSQAAPKDDEAPEIEEVEVEIVVERVAA
jgi:polyhydroxyalkanoate synthase